MIERGEFDTMREGIEAAGVIPAPLALQCLNNRLFPMESVTSDSTRGNSFCLHKKMQQGYLKRFPDDEGVPSGNRWNPSYELVKLTKKT